MDAAARARSRLAESAHRAKHAVSSAAGRDGSLNQTLPIVSLVFGIISVCCYVSPLTGFVALITGFMGMKNANNDPNNYGGKGLAIAGMIVGWHLLCPRSFVLDLHIFVVGLAALGQLGR